MFLRAGAVSLALLVASRLLGLARESAQAAAFGASGKGDVAVLMLALPDWIAGVLAAGALGYVLLPAWARAPGDVAHFQRRVAIALLAAGTLLGISIAIAPGFAIDVLAPGLGEGLRGPATYGLLWSAAALPLALLAALWTTRLQHEREFVGMYAANLVVNGVLVATLLLVAGAQSLPSLGAGLLVAMVARLSWLRWRLRRVRRAEGAPARVADTAMGAVPAPVAQVAAGGSIAAAATAVSERVPLSGGEQRRAAAGAPTTASKLPAASAWLWAALAAGLPLALPFAARSIASQSGEGSLATFNYAWKLVELPLMLAIQLVATLAFPAIARGIAASPDSTPPALRSGFAIAWTLACAAAAGLLVAAPAVAQVLFGWGRMDAQALARVADWGRIGAWGLLPQACIAVGVTVLAAQGRMAAVVGAYAVALAVLLASGVTGHADGGALMLLLNVLGAGVAIAVLASLGPKLLRGALPWRAFAAAGGALFACSAAAPLVARAGVAAQLLAAALAAAVTVAFAALASPDLRAALRR